MGVRLVVFCLLIGAVSSWFTSKPAPKPKDGAIRLAGGNKGGGRIEIYHGDAWGTVCDDTFNVHAAQVACRMLNLTGGNPKWHAYYGAGSGNIHLSDIQCTGRELNLTQCNIRNWDAGTCQHTDDAGVECEGSGDPIDGDVRLVGHNNKNEGRVEVFHRGSWGGVCSNSWGQPEARVICRQLGYKAEASKAKINAHYGRGEGRIWLANPRCEEELTKLSACEFAGWSGSGCTHSQDVGVECVAVSAAEKQREGEMRLAGTTTNWEGRVEILHNGEWGTVCDDGFDENAARVVCERLGHRGAATVKEAAFFGPGTGPVWLDELSCRGTERTLANCTHTGFGRSDCRHDEDAGVTCGSGSGVGGTDHGSSSGSGHGSSSGSSHGSSSGSSHGSSSGSGTGSSSGSGTGSNSGSGSWSNSGSSWNTGTTTTTTRRPSVSGGSGGSGGGGVRPVSAGSPNMRLVGGRYPNEGRLEVRNNGEWGTVCDDGFGPEEADVACRELGYTGGEFIERAPFGPGQGVIGISDVECRGHEAALARCEFEGWGILHCSHGEDVGLICR